MMSQNHFDPKFFAHVKKVRTVVQKHFGSYQLFLDWFETRNPQLDKQTPREWVKTGKLQHLMKKVVEILERNDKLEVTNFFWIPAVKTDKHRDKRRAQQNCGSDKFNRDGFYRSKKK